MKTLTLALATTAIAAAAASTLATTAEAGGRGGHRGFHFHLHQLQMRQAYRSYGDDDDYYVVGRRVTKVAPRVVAKPVAKPVEKPVAVAKYADGEGRQFDLASKVWFDGKSQCWMGDRAFAFKGGSWFYGNARWIESSAGWGVASGDVPERVSCEGIKAFSGKIQEAEAKPAKKTAETKPAPAKVEQAELKTVSKPAKVATTAPETAAKSNECKTYFPSVGEMVVVPCSE